MNFKHYDILSKLILGFITLVALMHLLDLKYNDTHTIPYLAFAFVIGYFLNGIGSLLESFFYWTIGGMPSDKLLTINKEKNYSGINQVRFYQTQKIIELLKGDVEDDNADKKKMFAKAMRSVNNKKRVSDFNANYAFSRTLLTACLIITVIFIIKKPSSWKTYFLFVPLLLAWERYRKNGYYYAREVLNEYLEFKEKKK